MPLIDELTIQADERGIIPQNFSCPSYPECDASTHGAMVGGAGCLLSYIGTNYETAHLKIAIIGMDHGENIDGDYFQRTEGIGTFYIEQSEPFNPHYNGVVRTAAAFLGTMGQQCSFCWQGNRCRKAVEPGMDCVLERIIQPNLVKCVPYVQNRTSRTTPVMRTHCVHHLMAELTLAHPRICIFHGAKAVDTVRPIIEQEGSQLLPLQDMRPYLAFHVPARDAYFVFLNHPSRDWLARRWERDVVPCLTYLREAGVIG